MKETRVKQHLARHAAHWADRLGRSVRVLPGLAALVCSVVGVGLVTDSIGWAILAAVPFLIAIDRGMP